MWIAGIFAAFASIIYPAISSLVSKNTDAEQQGVVLGILTGMRGLCNGLGPAIFGLLFWLSDVNLSEDSVELTPATATVATVMGNVSGVSISMEAIVHVSYRSSFPGREGGREGGRGGEGRGGEGRGGEGRGGEGRGGEGRGGEGRGGEGRGGEGRGAERSGAEGREGGREGGRGGEGRGGREGGREGRGGEGGRRGRGGREGSHDHVFHHLQYKW